MIRLGDEVRDAVKGFKGTVVRVCEWTNGSRLIGIQRESVQGGDPVDSQVIYWIKEEHVVVTKKVEPENTGPAEA